MNILYISASNMTTLPEKQGVSYQICEYAAKAAGEINPSASHSIIELKGKTIQPCTGCGGCFDTHRCCVRDDFGGIYEAAVRADAVVIVSPHYAPIPAKLAALLEKMEQITFLHWGRGEAYRSELFGKPAGIIAHGGGAAWAAESYRRMVCDTIANALDTIQLRMVPFDEENSTGLVLTLESAVFTPGSPFPRQEHDWGRIEAAVRCYIQKIMKALLHL